MLQDRLLTPYPCTPDRNPGLILALFIWEGNMEGVVNLIGDEWSRADSETRTADSETNGHADSETKIRKLKPRIRKLGFGN